MRSYLIVLIGLSILVGLTGCPEKSPSKPKPFPGNVSITYWIDADLDTNVTATGVKGSKHVHKPGGQLNAITKPEDHVSITAKPYVVGAKGRINVSIVQNNNGRVVCRGTNRTDNPDTTYTGKAECSGVIKI